VAADLPDLYPTFVVALAARSERDPSSIVVPHADGRLQVGCAVYPAAARTEAESAATQGERSLTRWVIGCATARGRGAPQVLVVEEAEWRNWGGGQSPFFNLNTPADRDQLTAREASA
jgi:molybdopterin-guanine dinucleotide biosynthesis protein A